MFSDTISTAYNPNEYPDGIEQRTFSIQYLTVEVNHGFKTALCN